MTDNIVVLGGGLLYTLKRDYYSHICIFVDIIHHYRGFNHCLPKCPYPGLLVPVALCLHKEGAALHFQFL